LGDGLSLIFATGFLLREYKNIITHKGSYPHLQEVSTLKTHSILVASYCAYFLKAEMRHVYRQIAGLKNVKTFVIARHRMNAHEYPFDDIEILNQKVHGMVRIVDRPNLKYEEHLSPFVYRGEYEGIRKILNRRDPDLMHVYFGHSGVHLLPFIRRWNRPCIVSFHGKDVQPRLEEIGYLADLKTLFSEVALVLVRSESIAERVRVLGCDPAKIRLNRTSVPMEQFREVPHRCLPTKHAWKVVQASRLIPKKGLFTSLKAFKAFADVYPNATFEIAGEGPLRPELECETQKLGLREKVRFIGFLNQNDLHELYSRAHLFIHPSEITPDLNQEGVPNSMLEAMATGLPVVATRHGGIPEAIEDGVSGFLVEEGDAHSLAERMLQLAGNRELRDSMGAAGAKQVREKFDSARGIAVLEDCYRNVLLQAGHVSA
jgi:colanic acid/amylovoran biosynthesis glycosyltransferase